MKKILCFLLVGIMTSCASTKITTSTTLIGDVSAYNDDGTILKKWEDIIISYSETDTYVHNNASTTYNKEDIIKAYGFNFYDPNTEKYIIINNAIPCIIEYTISTGETTVNLNSDTLTNADKSKEDMIAEYKNLNYQFKVIKTQMKGLDKNSEEYKKLNEKKKVIAIQKIKLEEEYSYQYYDYIGKF